MGRNGKNICDVPVIAKETVRFEFLENAKPNKLKSTTSYTTSNNKISTASTSDSSLPKTSVKPTSTPNEKSATTKKYWWLVDNLSQTKNITIDVKDESNTKIQFQSSKDISNQVPVQDSIENQLIVDGFVINNDKVKDKKGTKKDEDNRDRESISTGFPNLDKSEEKFTGK